MPAAEAEADGEDRGCAVLAETRNGGGDVRLDAVGGRLLDVRHVLEVVVPLPGACRPAEVVERDRGVPALGEAQRELLVEAVEPADVGQDHDPGAARLVGRGREGGEPVAVPRLEHEVVVRDRRAREHRDRRQRVGVEAHRPEPTMRAVRPRSSVDRAAETTSEPPPPPPPKISHKVANDPLMTRPDRPPLARLRRRAAAFGPALSRPVDRAHPRGLLHPTGAGRSRRR